MNEHGPRYDTTLYPHQLIVFTDILPTNKNGIHSHTHESLRERTLRPVLPARTANSPQGSFGVNYHPLFQWTHYTLRRLSANKHFFHVSARRQKRTLCGVSSASTTERRGIGPMITATQTTNTLPQHLWARRIEENVGFIYELEKHTHMTEPASPAARRRYFFEQTNQVSRRPPTIHPPPRPVHIVQHVDPCLAYSALSLLVLPTLAGTNRKAHKHTLQIFLQFITHFTSGHNLPLYLNAGQSGR